MNRTSTSSKTAARLLLTASALAFAAPALAHETLFASDASLGHAAEAGERVTQQSGVTQIRLSGGGVASFVAGASYQIRRDGSVDLFAGTVTVAGTEGSPIVVHLADQGEGRVAGRGSAASFSVDVREGGRNEARGHVLTGLVTIIFGNGSPRQFSAGQMWHGLGGRLALAVANGAAAVPTGDGSNSSVGPMGPHAGERASAAAAANNGVPVVLGDALAAAGASGDIVAAARRVQAASSNPSIETYPARDLAALVAYAARLNGAYGGVPFNGAAADIIRTYLQFLSGGGAQGNFLSAYAGFMVQYLDLIRAGALPSSFRGASLVQINSFISFRGRTVGFGSLSGQNKVLIDAYLAFIQGGGNADQFLVRYTDLTAAYFSYIRGGGTPSAFTGASQTTITAYLIFLRDAGLLANLTAQNQALLTAYLNSLTANGSGLAFADQYRTSLNLYYIYLQQGRLPSGYAAADVAALRQYLETLKTTGLFDSVLGSQASFFSGYLVWLQGGGAIDGYGQLPANVFAGYTSALTAYYDYLKQGGTPSGYTTLTQAQISAYLLALQNAGATSRYLGDFASFWTDYFAWINAGNNPNLFAGLPVPPDYPAFTSALNAYYVYLSNGGLPSNYSALTLEQLRNYINALIAAGRLSDLGGNASFLSAYFTYLGNGGAANGYAQLPVYVNYQSALTAYYTYLQNGGLPSAYTALTPAQLQAYLQAMIDAGLLGQFFTGQSLTFFQGYYSYVSGGGTANSYSGLATIATGSGSGSGTMPTGTLGASGLYTFSVAPSGLYSGGPADPGTPNIVLDANGRPSNGGYYGAPGTAALSEFKAGTGYLLARFGGGTFGTSGNMTTYAANDGAHFAILPLTSALPTSGTVTYTVIDQTTPTVPGGTGTFTGTGLAMTLGVTFGSAPKFGYNGSIDGAINGQAVSLNFTSAGGATAPSLTNAFTSSGTLSLYGGVIPLASATGAICTGAQSCSLAANFISGGAGAAKFALGYGVIDTGTNRSILNGAAVLGNPVTSGGSSGGGGSGSGLAAPTGTVWVRTVGQTNIPGTSTRSAQGSFFSNATTSVTANADGQLQIGDMSGEQITRLTATNADFGTAGGVIGWARWAGGTVRYLNNTTAEIPANGGLAFVWGTPVTNMPTTGTVNYALAGSTKPTLQSGAAVPGTLNNAALAVNFASMSASFSANLTVNSVNYAISNNAPMPVASNGTFSNFNSTSHILGFLAGPGASHAGVSYNIFGPGVSGTIAFAKPGP